VATGGDCLGQTRLLEEYLATLGIGEHFFAYRYEVREQLLKQLADLKQQKARVAQLEKTLKN
jgi:hypothetical protein